METLDCLSARVTATRFDPDRGIDQEDLRDLVRHACRAPSAFHQQHWRFVAVQDAEARAALSEAAHGDPRVAEAPLVLVALGDLRAYEDLADTLRPTVEKGELDRATAERWVRQAAKEYSQPQAARDEAQRSVSMAVMCLLLAARDKGLASACLTSLDVEALRTALAVSERYLPVALVALGHPLPGDTQRQKVRLGLGTVLHEGSAEALPG